MVWHQLFCRSYTLASGCLLLVIRFLDCAAHPTMTYRSIGVIERPRGEWTVFGELTL